MKEWYICKAKYMDEDDQGFSKMVTKAYLLDAVNYTEAESRIHTELKYNLNKEFLVTNITKTNINEVITGYDDGIAWWKAKVQYTIVNADSEKEQKMTQYFILPANDIQESYERLTESLEKLLADWLVLSIQHTAIIDVYPYISPEENIDDQDVADDFDSNEKTELAENDDEEDED